MEFSTVLKVNNISPEQKSPQEEEKAMSLCAFRAASSLRGGAVMTGRVQYSSLGVCSACLPGVSEFNSGVVRLPRYYF